MQRPTPPPAAVRSRLHVVDAAEAIEVALGVAGSPDPTPHELAQLEASRPHVRGDCVDGLRPCPFVTCRFNLRLDLRPRSTGHSWSSQLPLPTDAGTCSCALDVADAGELGLEDVAVVFGTTKETVRQVADGALRKVKAVLGGRPELLAEILAPPPPAQRPPERPRRQAQERRVVLRTPAARRRAARPKANGMRLPVLQPEDPVRCDYFTGTLPVRICIARQRARWPGGNRVKSGVPHRGEKSLR